MQEREVKLGGKLGSSPKGASYRKGDRSNDNRKLHTQCYELSCVCLKSIRCGPTPRTSEGIGDGASPWLFS